MNKINIPTLLATIGVITVFNLLINNIGLLIILVCILIWAGLPFYMANVVERTGDTSGFTITYIILFIPIVGTLICVATLLDNEIYYRYSAECSTKTIFFSDLNKLNPIKDYSFKFRNPFVIKKKSENSK